MSLAQAAHELGWPQERWILKPPGAGAAVNAALAERKIRSSLAPLEGAGNARVGVLSLDPTAAETQAPLALVCAFDRPAPVATLAELHRLAWNFSRTPLLLTVDTHRLQAFTCCEPPSTKEHTDTLPSEIPEARYEFKGTDRPAAPLAVQASQALHWLELASGRFIQRHERRFRRDRCADTLLLENLRFARSELHERGLKYDIIHDLLARIIFVQFLFDRRDSSGYTALNAEHLSRLHRDGILSEPYQTFGEVLGNHADCYRLFWYLDDRFNGDLFPGQGAGDPNRQQYRDMESALVEESHLRLLSEFVTGRMQLRSGQYSLWPQYSFDTIPLEFISSIYETFVTGQKGTVYTPAHLVDFILDGVLPWDDPQWDLKILDPACGSGVFLVKVFQRLIHRWKRAHPGQRIDSDTLRSLLERNLFGVDVDPHAVRTASFSLYLAMCDEIDPRHYWTQVRFPNLRDQCLVSRDFFSEENAGFRTNEDAQHYDVVVGNAPWGKNTIQESSAAREWAKEYKWPVSYGDIGPLFPAKSAALTKPSGWISLLQPCGTLLFNGSANARKFRSRLFNEFTVTEVVNFSALRFGLFSKAVGPAALVTLHPTASSEEPLSYISPKPLRASGTDDYRIVIDPYDVHEVHPREAVEDSVIWSAFMWGGRRDLALLRRMEKRYTLAKHESEKKVVTRQGIIRGDQKKFLPDIVGKRILEDKDFPDDIFLRISPRRLSLNKNPWIDEDGSTDFSAFVPMQLIVKKTWAVDHGRFRAVVVDPPNEGVIFSDSYVSIRAEKADRSILDAACLCYNSSFAVYYLFLRAGRFASYRPSPTVAELLSVPIPCVERGLLHQVKTLEDLDRHVYKSFDFKPAERVLMEDVLRHTLPDFKGDADSPGRSPTRRSGADRDGTGGGETELHAWCAWFIRVLRAGFGRTKPVCATIFEEVAEERLPVRLVAMHLDCARETDVIVESIGGGDLVDRLQRTYRLLVDDAEEGVGFRRVARVFDVWDIEGRQVPTVVFVKPDQARYWSRSVALRDADEVSGEIMQRALGTERA